MAQQNLYRTKQQGAADATTDYAEDRVAVTDPDQIAKQLVYSVGAKKDYIAGYLAKIAELTGFAD